MYNGNMERRGRSQGYVLLLVMIGGFIIALVGVGLLSFGGKRNVAGIRSEHESQVYWALDGALASFRSALDQHGGDLRILSVKKELLLRLEPGGEGKYIIVNGYKCFIDVVAVEGTDFDNDVYATTKDSGGAIRQISQRFRQPGINQYAWGVYNAGAWDVWGRDLDGGKDGVNMGEMAINWGGGDTIGGPFVVYDMLTLKDKTTPLQWGKAKAINFFGNNLANILPSLRRNGVPWDLRGVCEDAALTEDEKDQKFGKRQYEIFSSNLVKKILVGRNVGDNSAIYDHMAEGTVFARARNNYLSITQNIDPLTGTAGGSSPENVYRIEFRPDGTYYVEKGRVYFCAKLSKGIMEMNRAELYTGTGSILGKLRYYLDVNSNRVNDVDVNNRTIQSFVDGSDDLPIFLDIEFTNNVTQPAGLPYVGVVSDLMEPLYIDGDIYIEGEVNGRITLVGADNCYIGPKGIVYASAPDPTWTEWATGGNALQAAVQNLGVSSFSEAVAHHYDAMEPTLMSWMDSGLTDMLTVMVKRQVILLGDDEETSSINVHGAYIMPWDVDYDFGSNFSCEMEKLGNAWEDRVVLAPMNEKEFYTNFLVRTNSFVPGLRAEKEVHGGKEKYWWYFYRDQGQGEQFDKKNPLEKLIYAPGQQDKWKDDVPYAKFIKYQGGKYSVVYSGDAAAPAYYSHKNIRRRDYNYGPGEFGWTDTFYKDYGACGMSPWDKHVKLGVNPSGPDSFAHIFGGMIEYRHSRFVPARGGLRRNFLYDNRLLKQRTPGIASDEYEYEALTEMLPRIDFGHY